MMFVSIAFGLFKALQPWNLTLLPCCSSQDGGFWWRDSLWRSSKRRGPDSFQEEVFHYEVFLMKMFYVCWRFLVSRLGCSKHCSHITWHCCLHKIFHDKVFHDKVFRHNEVLNYKVQILFMTRVYMMSFFMTRFMSAKHCSHWYLVAYCKSQDKVFDDKVFDDMVLKDEVRIPFMTRFFMTRFFMTRFTKGITYGLFKALEEPSSWDEQLAGSVKFHGCYLVWIVQSTASWKVDTV